MEERQVWDVKYAEYLAELDKQKTSPCNRWLQRSPQLKSTLQILLATAVHLDLPTRNVLEFTNLLATGFTDTFRHIHGDVPERYTWWAQRSKTSKINNTGWRIDYWLTSNRVADKVTKSDMIDSGARQDHTPIVLEIEL